MKRAKAVKIPNLLIWLIFNQHKMLRNCLEEDVCLYVLMHGEEYNLSG